MGAGALAGCWSPGSSRRLPTGDSDGAVLRLAHTPPSLLLGCGPGATDRLRRSAGVAWQEGAAPRKDTHLLLLLTMERVDGAWAVARIAALPTDRHYLPVTSLPDLLLTEHLVDDGRYLFKPLAYDGCRDDYPTALLTDVGRRAVPLERCGHRRRVSPCGPAASYDRLLRRLTPKFLLGLTATPERADGKSVLEWFDGRTAFKSRLWDALDQGLLCPFHYFGVNDTTDLSTVRFERGRYVAGDLDNVLTGDHVRALRVRHAVEE